MKNQYGEIISLQQEAGKRLCWKIQIQLFVLFFIICGCWLTQPSFASSPKDVVILRQDDTGIRFVYTPDRFDKQRIDIGSRQYWRYQFLDATTLTQPGEPEIPGRLLVFAVPEGSEVTATVLASEFVEENEVELLPVPFVEPDGEAAKLNYPENYQLPSFTDWFPGTTVQLEAPAYFGDLRIVRLQIAGLQYLPAQRQVRRFTRFEIELNFSSPPRTEQVSIAKKTTILNKDLLRIVENQQQAQKWLLSESPAKLRKIKNQFGMSDYYKIPITEEGFYKITGKFLQDHNIDIAMIDPSTLKIFNNGGRALPLSLSSPRPDSLIENAIQVVDGGDGRFDTSDYLLFYAIGVNNWNYSNERQRFTHYLNSYTFTNIYWLTFNDGRPGKRMESQIPPATASRTMTTYQARQFIEDEIINIYHSGTVWFGAEFNDQIPSKQLSLTLVDLLPSNRIHLLVHLYSPSTTQSKFQFLFDGQSLGYANFYGARAYDVEIDTPIVAGSDQHKLEIRFTPTSELSVAYLDWLEISSEAELRLQNNLLLFWGPQENGDYEYHIVGAAGNDYNILDITDYSNVKRITAAALANNEIIFRVQQESNRPRKYLIAGADQIRDVSEITQDEASDWRNPANGADFIIITHDNFFNAASALKNLRESHDGLRTVVIKIDDVYDEFSAGLFDPTAIRDLLYYAFNNWSVRPQYVLLFGDGDYDYKNIKSKNDSNWIPPYETANLNEFDNRTTDDWFTYVHGNDSDMDLSIGRLPVQTTAEAEYVVDKLMEYCTDSPYGNWRNIVTIVADDELVMGGTGNETIHTIDSENLAEVYLPKQFDLKKIYLTEYPVVLDASSSWLSKPIATEDFLNRINEGTLLINFIGHGAPDLLTHERLLKQSRDENRIQNGNRYAFWVAATCDFGLWDNPEEQSFAEVLLKMEKRGAIAMLTSARLVFASSNASFNKQFISYLFQNPKQPMRLGDAVRLAKIAAADVVNNEKFHILGDPTLLLEVPKLEVKITNLAPDSLKALSRITVDGQIWGEDGSPSELNGQIYMNTYDSRRDVTYTTKAGSQINYKMPGNPIFRGQGTVTNGKIQMQFIVPKDISYGGKNGRLSLYFSCTDQDGAGYIDHLIVDGTSYDFVDTEGPQIEFESHQLNVGDYVVFNSDDVLKVLLTDDQSGVNITGDVGHKITVTPDEDPQNQKEVTYLFEYEPDSYLRGTVQLPLTIFPQFAYNESSDNLHQFTFKAWDNSNNSSRKSLYFEVVQTGNLVLKDVLNYPNPFQNSTTFTFYLNNEAQIDIKIFTLSGRLITHLRNLPATFGFNLVPWDGRDQDGDDLANGVYLYRIRAIAEEHSVESVGKLVKMQ